MLTVLTHRRPGMFSPPVLGALLTSKRGNKEQRTYISAVAATTSALAAFELSISCRAWGSAGAKTDRY